jgi:BirA family biotin operon repressor/biotin-[acetyl-CoA-carboxylase] ligase
MISAEELQNRLPVHGLGRPFYYYDRIDSTNTRAKVLVQDGAPHGALVVADEQTAGRGRGERTWYTPPGTAIALSLVLRIGSSELARWDSLAMLGALAVAEALVPLGQHAEVKWPNDVLLRGLKVAGVLVENVFEGETLVASILGIGVNVHAGSVPEDGDLSYPATWVDAQCDRRVSRLTLILTILEQVGAWYPRLGGHEMVAAVDARLAFRGRKVCVQTGDVKRQGELLGLAADGRLRLSLPDGTEASLVSGEIRLRPVDMT